MPTPNQEPTASDKLIAAFEKKIQQAKTEAVQARAIRNHARKELEEERRKLEEQMRLIKALKLKLAKNPNPPHEPQKKFAKEDESIPLVVQHLSCRFSVEGFSNPTMV